MHWILLFLLYAPLYATILGVCAIALSGPPRVRVADGNDEPTSVPPWSRAA